MFWNMGAISHILVSVEPIANARRTDFGTAHCLVGTICSVFIIGVSTRKKGLGYVQAAQIIINFHVIFIAHCD